MREVHIQKRIPGALYFNFGEISDHGSPYNYMLPQEEEFTEIMKGMGVKRTDTIVCYDALNMMAAPRVSWMLRAFGAENVFVLDGTFRKWLEEGRDVQEGPSGAFMKKVDVWENFDYKLNPKMVKTFEQMKENVDTDEFTVFDSRFAQIYSQMGNICGSKNVPFTEVLNADKTFK